MRDRAEIAEAVVASSFRERLGLAARGDCIAIAKARLGDLANFQFLAGL
jgi:hypothetical protein